MISIKNKVLNEKTDDQNFTIEHYRELLRLAINQYEFASYNAIPWGNRFILWRHDMDYSLNRGLALARIEQEEGIKATYFINPHSEFYNISEAGQHKIILDILALGHDIGLHFDAAFYCVNNEEDLNRLVAEEAAHLYWLFGVKPVAFSFHNPVAENLACEADEYGGLINCYSKRFKTEVPYCSDSNGYWRFKRLYDVLSEAKEHCLQVLTHPGWWQENAMPPRQRIFRAIFGRASATMQFYDDSILQHGRINQTGASLALQVLKSSHREQFEACDYLWNRGHYQTLFIELWRLHEAQIKRLCKAHLRINWQVPEQEVNDFFGNELIHISGWMLFDELFDRQWINVLDIDMVEYKRWIKIRGQINHGIILTVEFNLEAGCVYLCQVIEKLSEWGGSQFIGYDGLENMKSIDLSINKSEKSYDDENLSSAYRNNTINIQKHWEKIKKQFSNANERAGLN